MEKSEKKKIFDHQLSILEKKMDDTDKVYQMLEDLMLETGTVPTEYLPHWTAYITNGRYLIKGKTWRSVPGVKRRIRMAAKKCTENVIKRRESEKTN